MAANATAPITSFRVMLVPPLVTLLRSISYELTNTTSPECPNRVHRFELQNYQEKPVRSARCKCIGLQSSSKRRQACQKMATKIDTDTKYKNCCMVQHRPRR